MKALLFQQNLKKMGAFFLAEVFGKALTEVVSRSGKFSNIMLFSFK